MSAVRLVTLADRPDLVPLVTDWVWEAFGRQEGASRDAYLSVVAGSVARLGAPQCFVLLEGDEPAGTASFVLHDCDSRPELSPWLASVYVRPEARGRGHAGTLVRAVEKAAAEAGTGTLWLYTNTAERIYARLGWRRVEAFTHHGNAQVLMSKELGSRS